jgi:hypothetical protein
MGLAELSNATRMELAAYQVAKGEEVPLKAPHPVHVSFGPDAAKKVGR